MIVGEIMSKKIATLNKNCKLSECIKIMEKNRVQRVIVTDSKGIFGIVTEKDIVETLCASRYRTVSTSRLHVSTAATKNVITVKKSDDAKKAANLMFENHISSIPVVEKGKLVGIVTKSDFAKLLTDSRIKISAVMSRRVVSVSPSERVVHVRRIMLDRKISRVVVTENGRVVGMITEKDVVRVLSSFRKRIPEGYIRSRIKKLLAGDTMTQNVISVDLSSTVGKLCGIMLEKNLSGVPVTENGKLVGIVTITDLLKLVSD